MTSNEKARRLRKMSDGELFTRELFAEQDGDLREMYLYRHYRTFEVADGTIHTRD